MSFLEESARVDMQQLKHFLAVAETGNIARAAERLGLTQSGLSRSIQALEAGVQLPLFDRRSRGVVLTASGEELLPRAKSILAERERALAAMHAFRSLEQGSLSIGVMPTFSYAVAPALVAAVINSSPGVSVSVITANHERLVRNLLGAEIDCALVLAVSPEHSELNYQPLYAADTAVFASLRHPLAHRDRLEVHDLLSYPWALTDSLSLRLAFDAFFKGRTGRVPAVRLTCSSIAILAQSMESSELLSVMPREFIHADIINRRVTCLPVEAPASEARAWLVTRRHQAQGPPLQLALQLLNGILAETPEPPQRSILR